MNPFLINAQIEDHLIEDDCDAVVMKYYCANNDVNGNPRRLFALVENSRVLAAWDEGYKGTHCVPGVWRKQAWEAMMFDKHGISVKQYNEILRTAPSPAWGHEVPGYEHLRDYATADY
jgi:hypothetical protein